MIELPCEKPTALKPLARFSSACTAAANASTFASMFIRKPESVSRSQLSADGTQTEYESVNSPISFAMFFMPRLKHCDGRGGAGRGRRREPGGFSSLWGGVSCSGFSLPGGCGTHRVAHAVGDCDRRVGLGPRRLDTARELELRHKRREF
jgi:hypothetical protein